MLYTLLWYVVLCCVMPRNFVQCCVLFCFAVLCCALLCCAVICCAMLCSAMLGRAMPSNAVLCFVMLCYALLCCVVVLYDENMRIMCRTTMYIEKQFFIDIYVICLCFFCTSTTTYNNVHLNLFCVVCITLSIDLIYQLNAYHIFFEVYK